MVKFYLNIIEKLVLNTIGKLSSFYLTLPLNADVDTISINYLETFSYPEPQINVLEKLFQWGSC